MSDRAGIICAGNWIVDLVHDIEHWPRESDLTRINAQTRGIGGGPANVISALARFQTNYPLWPVGALGDDDYAAFVRSECAALGLPTIGLITKKETATAHTHVMSVAGQSRTFFYQGGANDVLSVDDIRAALDGTPDAKVFYLGYLTLLETLDRLDPEGHTGAAQVLKQARAAGMITCVDLVSIDRPDFADILAPALPEIDYLIVNEVEAARAAGHALPEGGDPTTDALSRRGTALIAKGVRHAVVIHCPGQAVAVRKDGQTQIAAFEDLPADRIVSALGAGDAFCAGVLHGIHEGWPLDESMQLGHVSARASLQGATATEAIPSLKILLAQVQS